MNGIEFFVDTNILIYQFENEKLNSFLNNKVLYCSFISELELLSKKELSPSEENKIKTLLKNLIVIDINNSIKEIAVSIRKKYNIKLPDAIIAATAKYLSLPLLTADKYLEKIDDIDVVLITL